MVDYNKSFLMSPGLFMDIPDTPNYIDPKDADFIFQKERVCSFTGYRPEKFAFFKESDPRCTELKFKICAKIIMIIKQGVIIPNNAIIEPKIPCALYPAQVAIFPAIGRSTTCHQNSRHSAHFSALP